MGRREELAAAARRGELCCASDGRSLQAPDTEAAIELARQQCVGRVAQCFHCAYVGQERFFFVRPDGTMSKCYGSGFEALAAMVLDAVRS